MSNNNNYSTARKFSTLSSSSNYNRRSVIRRRLELHSRTGDSVEDNNSINYHQNTNSNNNLNSNTNTSITYDSRTFRQSSNNLNSNIIPRTLFQNPQNSQNISVNEDLSTSYRRRHLNKNIFISVYKNKKNLSKKLFEIEEEQKKEENEKISQKEKDNIGSEIKDTVKCYICFDKITKPKMCPHCHRIACEKCLHNWFINLNKKNCGFCREKVNYNQMVSVPFMEKVVDFVDNFFNNKMNNLNSSQEKNSNFLDNDFIEYCPEHKNEMLYYYCLDCGKAYCKTCFVFFGEEKDKHIGHSIIEYEKYKNMSFPLLKKNKEKLEINIKHVEENIKRCLAYKKIYEHERNVGNMFITKLQKEFNKHIDNIMNTVDQQISKLKEYINEYNKYKKELDDFYDSMKNKKSNSEISCESLIIKLTKVNQQKFFSSKDIKKLNDLSKDMFVNTYQSKVGQFNHDNMFLKKGLKLGNSPYEIVIDNKQRNEVQISLLMPKEKTTIKHNFQALAFIKKKGECIQSYELDEFKEDENYVYLRKKIPWDFFGQSIFEIKGILYDFYFS